MPFDLYFWNYILFHLLYEAFSFLSLPCIEHSWCSHRITSVIFCGDSKVLQQKPHIYWLFLANIKDIVRKLVWFLANSHLKIRKLFSFPQCWLYLPHSSFHERKLSIILSIGKLVVEDHMWCALKSWDFLSAGKNYGWTKVPRLAVPLFRRLW